MRFGRSAICVIGGLAAAATLVASMPSQSAQARTRKRGRNRGALRMVDINVDGFAGIPQNVVIEMRFTGTISKASIIPALFQIRGENALGTGFTLQVAGDFQPFGNVVRFFPRLPTPSGPASPDQPARTLPSRGDGIVGQVASG